MVLDPDALGELIEKRRPYGLAVSQYSVLAISP